jgi:hypothetical protein
MIIKGSRYSQSVETRNDTTKNVATPSTFTSNTQFSVIAEEGQTFQYLAALYLNDATMYWKIADINTNITFPDSLSAGTLVNIPIL